MSTPDPMLAVQLLQAESAVREHPGRTLPELAEAVGAAPALLGACLRQLEQAGRVHRFVPVTCRVTGKPRMPWFVGPDPMDSTAMLPTDLVADYAEAMRSLPLPSSAAEAA